MAGEWLRTRLEEGPVRSDIIRAEGKELGFSYSTLLKAANDLDISSTSVAELFQRRTVWSLDDE